MERKRIVSGMRPTGSLHLGHVHGALINWRSLQKDYQCFYFIADWKDKLCDLTMDTIITQLELDKDDYQFDKDFGKVFSAALELDADN